MRKGLYILLLISFWSCRKDNFSSSRSLPDATTIGAQTIGFMMPTGVWRNDGQVCFPFAGGCRENIRAGFQNSTRSFWLTADEVLRQNGQVIRSSNIDFNLNIRTSAIGNYSTMLGNSIQFSLVKRSSSSAISDTIYVLPSVAPRFEVNLTRFDTTAGIVSARFSGVLFRRNDLASFSTSTTDSLVIRDGRLDVRMR